MTESNLTGRSDRTSPLGRSRGQSCPGLHLKVSLRPKPAMCAAPCLGASTPLTCPSPSSPRALTTPHLGFSHLQGAPLCSLLDFKCVSEAARLSPRRAPESLLPPQQYRPASSNKLLQRFSTGLAVSYVSASDKVMLKIRACQCLPASSPVKPEAHRSTVECQVTSK